jgi:hypothetical protein
MADEPQREIDDTKLTEGDTSAYSRRWASRQRLESCLLLVAPIGMLALLWPVVFAIVGQAWAWVFTMVALALILAWNYVIARRIKAEKGTEAGALAVSAGCCPFCHDEIGSLEGAFRCPGCNTRHHMDCWQEHGGCSVFRCEKGRANISAAPNSEVTGKPKRKEPPA